MQKNFCKQLNDFMKLLLDSNNYLLNWILTLIAITYEKLINCNNVNVVANDFNTEKFLS